jgi:hypothetical protein
MRVAAGVEAGSYLRGWKQESTVVLMPKDLCAKRIPKKKNKMARIRKKFHLEAFFFKTAACDE